MTLENIELKAIQKHDIENIGYKKTACRGCGIIDCSELPHTSGYCDKCLENKTVDEGE